MIKSSVPTKILPRVIITYGACARGGGRRRLCGLKPARPTRDRELVPADCLTSHIATTNPSLTTSFSVKGGCPLHQSRQIIEPPEARSAASSS